MKGFSTTTVLTALGILLLIAFFYVLLIRISESDRLFANIETASDIHNAGTAMKAAQLFLQQAAAYAAYQGTYEAGGNGGFVAVGDASAGCNDGKYVYWQKEGCGPPDRHEYELNLQRSILNVMNRYTGGGARMFAYTPQSFALPLYADANVSGTANGFNATVGTRWSVRTNNLELSEPANFTTPLLVRYFGPAKNNLYDVAAAFASATAGGRTLIDDALVSAIKSMPHSGSLARSAGCPGTVCQAVGDEEVFSEANSGNWEAAFTSAINSQLQALRSGWNSRYPDFSFGVTLIDTKFSHRVYDCTLSACGQYQCGEHKENYPCQKEVCSGVGKDRQCSYVDSTCEKTVPDYSVKWTKSCKFQYAADIKAVVTVYDTLSAYPVYDYEQSSTAYRNMRLRFASTASEGLQ